MGQQAPGTATPQDVHAGIDQHALLVAQRRPDPWGGNKEASWAHWPAVKSVG